MNNVNIPFNLRNFIFEVFSRILNYFEIHKKLAILIVTLILGAKFIGLKYFLLAFFCILTFVWDYLNGYIKLFSLIDNTFFLYFILAYLYDPYFALLHPVIIMLPKFNKINFFWILSLLSYLICGLLIETFKTRFSVALIFIILFAILKIVSLVQELFLNLSANSFIDYVIYITLAFLDFNVNQIFFLPFVLITITFGSSF